MAVDKKVLKEHLMNDYFIISGHARIRMFQRNISTDDITRTISELLPFTHRQRING
ncbi:MAG: DUF4258 domain-containing protein [Euryarchaeota archaeon]|nr:DUF4258 domain-containing protein [Euryarchaeota archaeon]